MSEAVSMTKQDGGAGHLPFECGRSHCIITTEQTLARTDTLQLLKRSDIIEMHLEMQSERSY